MERSVHKHGERNRIDFRPELTRAIASALQAEFWIASMKLVGLCAYYIWSIVYVAGGVNGDKVGARYWHDPGPFNGNGFRGVASVFVFCSTFYSGVESVAISAAETASPRRALPMAIRQVFWR